MSGYTHWTNCIDAKSNQLNRYLQGSLKAKEVRSMHLELNKSVLFEQLNELLLQMLRIESISIRCQKCIVANQVEGVFKIISVYEHVRELELSIESNNNPLDFLLFAPTNQVTTLSINIQKTQNYSMEQIQKVLEGYSKLTFLTLNYNQEINLGTAIKDNDFFRSLTSFLNPEWLKVSQLRIDFNRLESLSDKDVVDFGVKIASLKTVRELWINFNQTKLSLKACEGFLFELARSKLRLKGLALGISCSMKEQILKVLGRLLKHQLNLEWLELNDFEIRGDQIKTFLNHQRALKNLKAVHYDISKNNIRNDGLSQIARFFSFTKAYLTTIKIFFDYSIFSGECVFEFGKALASMVCLKDLRLQFTGKIKDCSIVEFADNIASCKALEYLFINFSGHNDDANNKVEVESEGEGKSILERERLSMEMESRSRWNHTVQGSYHPLLILTAVARETKGKVKQFIYSIPSLYKSPSIIDQAINNNIDKVLMSLTGLEKIEFQDSYFGRDKMMTIFQLIERNAPTLVSLDTNYSIQKPLMDILIEKAGKNLLSLKICSNSRDFNSTFLLKGFPNIGCLFLERGYRGYSYQDSLIYPPELVQTDLTQFESANETQSEQMNLIPAYYRPKLSMIKRTYYQNEKQIVRSCLIERRKFILMQTVFNRDINGLLIYKPQFMAVDLWIDSNDDLREKQVEMTV